MSSSHGDRQWNEVVALMRLDARDLGHTLGESARFVRRFTATNDALLAQQRRVWGLNGHEMQAINLLWEFGRMTMTELGKRIPLSRAAVTTLTDRLERSGYVQRTPDPLDRRRILLEVTPLVETEMGVIHAQFNRDLQAYVDQLDPAAWATVVNVMSDIRDLARAEGDRLRTEPRDKLTRQPDNSGRGKANRPPSWW